MAILEAKPRISQLRQEIAQLEEERKVIQAQVEELQGDDVQLSVEERARLEEEWKQWQRHATTRRRICRELWGRCTEVLPDNTTSQELWVSFRVPPNRSPYVDGLCRSRSGSKGRSNKEGLTLSTGDPPLCLHPVTSFEGDLQLGRSGASSSLVSGVLCLGSVDFARSHDPACIR